MGALHQRMLVHLQMKTAQVTKTAATRRAILPPMQHKAQHLVCTGSGGGIVLCTMRAAALSQTATQRTTLCSQTLKAPEGPLRPASIALMAALTPVNQTLTVRRQMTSRCFVWTSIWSSISGQSGPTKRCARRLCKQHVLMRADCVVVSTRLFMQQMRAMLCDVQVLAPYCFCKHCR